MDKTDYKKRYEQIKRKYNKMKPYADTMSRHNDRLNNHNKALESTVETFRSKLEMLCPHKTEYLSPRQETKWGNDVMHYCTMCYQFVKTEELNRTI